MGELRECPFCAGDAAVSEEIGWGCMVICLDCDACGTVRGEREAAIAAWNRRAEDRYTLTENGRRMWRDRK